MMPETIGRYEIRGELGEGGMAAVFRGYDPRFGREVAVKVILQRFMDNESLHIRFEREARTIAALEHPAIVPVYDFGEDETRPYLVMRLMTGGSLKDRLEQGPLSTSEALTIVQRIGGALNEAHAKGIVHRDLKPGNILFDRFGTAYLSDFGIVRVAESDVTLTGQQTIGTPGYMSPEQIEAVDVDYRADIYALGVMIFQMLSGQLPYTATSAAMVMLKHMTEQVPDVHLINKAVPAGVSDVIARCMAKKKEDRPQSATAVADLLAAALDGDGGLMPASRPRAVAPPTSQTGATVAAPLGPAPDPTATQAAASTSGEAPVPRTEVMLPDWKPTRPAAAESPGVPAAATDGEPAGRSSRRWLWIGGGILAFFLFAIVGVVALAALSPAGDESGEANTPAPTAAAVVEEGGGEEVAPEPTATDAPVVAAGPRLVVVAGTFQSELGCPEDWQPSCERTAMQFDDGRGVWTATFTLPPGRHEYKIAMNGTWEGSVGARGEIDGPNIRLPLLRERAVTFTYDPEAGVAADDVDRAAVEADLTAPVGGSERGVGRWKRG